MPFCTHEGSGLGNSELDIVNACPKAKILKGLAIYGSQVNAAKTDIKECLNKINI
jgi:flavodoxin